LIRSSKQASMSTQVKAGLWITTTILFISSTFYGYQMVFTPNFLVKKESKVLLIPNGTEFPQLIDSLKVGGYVVDMISFGFLARLLDYQENIKPGAYQIPSNANNFSVIKMLKSGRQVPIRLTFHNLRTKTQLIEKIDAKLQMNRADFDAFMNNPDSVAQLGFDTTTIVSMFIPNTYEFFWNTKPHVFFRKMKKEYDKFWTAERLAKAEALKLTPVQVSILASIVETETTKSDEMPRVAGVYHNRLKENMMLQADPTVVFAVGDFTIKRVLSGHKAVDSPYNTYKYNGLPPGPIYVPSIRTLDAVLNRENHDYLFFCAKEDFSGYHRFTRDFNEHLANARKYQKALNEAGIR